MASRLYQPIVFNPNYSYHNINTLQYQHQQSSSYMSASQHQPQQSSIRGGQARVRNVTVANTKSKRRKAQRKIPYYLRLSKNYQRVSHFTV